MITDPIADFLTQIRNAIQARHREVYIKSSTIKKRITEVLCEQGYIRKYEFHDDEGIQGRIRITLKYAPKTKEAAIVKLMRVSKPGRRSYKNKTTLAKVLNGLGVGIISTSQGVMTDKEARKRNIGGEELCHVY